MVMVSFRLSVEGKHHILAQGSGRSDRREEIFVVGLEVKGISEHTRLVRPFTYDNNQLKLCGKARRVSF